MLAWLTAIGVQTIRDVRYRHVAPLPSEYVASGAVFGVLAVIAGDHPGRSRVVGVIAWGLVIAAAMAAGGPHELVTSGIPGKIGEAFTPGGPPMEATEPGPREPHGGRHPRKGGK